MIHTMTAKQHRGRAGQAAAGEETLPVWLAVLIAACCQASGDGGPHDVLWSCVEGRATYTNFGRKAETIEPLGVNLSMGETLAVFWTPGDTTYTMEVYSQAELCA